MRSIVLIIALLAASPIGIALAHQGPAEGTAAPTISSPSNPEYALFLSCCDGEHRKKKGR